MPSVGGIVTLFAGALVGSAGTAWAVANSQPVPWSLAALPFLAFAVTWGILSAIASLRARHGVPLSPAARATQRRVLAAAWLIGLLVGTWTGWTMPRTPATAPADASTP
jgi:hypothetical protein